MPEKKPRRRKRCLDCRFWLESQAPRYMNLDWQPQLERLGFCQHPSRADEPAERRVFGAGGGCALFSTKEETHGCAEPTDH